MSLIKMLSERFVFVGKNDLVNNPPHYFDQFGSLEFLRYPKSKINFKI